MKQAIILVGGYNSLWPIYLKMASDLERLSGLPASIVPLMPWHWWSARQTQEATNILRRLAETVARARRKFRADRFILVGHSAGGLIARLYLCDQPVWGRTYAGVEHVTTLVTLGSPHCSTRGTDTGWFLTNKANRLAPGAFYSDRIRYHAIAGQSVQGRRYGRLQERQAFRAYRFFAGQGDIWGDGVVPVRCAGLDGAEMLVLEGIGHSRRSGTSWYGGSPAIVRQWWPEGASYAN